MAQRFYAPKILSVLTVSRQPGTVDDGLIQDNIARMLLMSREEVSAKEAQELLDEMNGQEWSDLMNRASRELYSPEMQDYLSREAINHHRLYPIEEVLSEEDEPLSPEEAEELMWERLDEFNWTTFEEVNLHPSEWD